MTPPELVKAHLGVSDATLAHMDTFTEKRIVAGSKLHTDVQQFRMIESRVLGHVHHSAKIEVGPDGFLHDWSMIVLDNDKIDLAAFHGNKLYVGTSESASDPYTLSHS